MGNSNSGNYSINVGPNSGIHIQYLALHQKICYPDNTDTKLPNIGVAAQVSTELPPSDPLPVPTTLGLCGHHASLLIKEVIVVLHNDERRRPSVSSRRKQRTLPRAYI